MKAVIQFIQGIEEEMVPEVKLTRSRDGSTGTATFRFQQPTIFDKNMAQAGEITGMFMLDEEGILTTRDVNAFYIMKNREEWDRFMRFMERYSFVNNLSFTKSNSSLS